MAYFMPTQEPTETRSDVSISYACRMWSVYGLTRGDLLAVAAPSSADCRTWPTQPHQHSTPPPPSIRAQKRGNSDVTVRLRREAMCLQRFEHG